LVKGWATTGRRLLVASAISWGLSVCPARAASFIGTTDTAFNSATHFHTHCAAGHFWVVFENNTVPPRVKVFSSPDGVTWTDQGNIFTFNPDNTGKEWAVRFSGTKIVAMAHKDLDSTRYYRNGTLNSNGTITWNAAESAAGPPDANWQPLNALIANNKPVMWRADEFGAGAFWIGSALNGPTWTKTATDAPALGPTTAGGFAARADLPDRRLRSERSHRFAGHQQRRAHPQQPPLGCAQVGRGHRHLRCLLVQRLDFGGNADRRRNDPRPGPR
jgi:hypothetical protein